MQGILTEAINGKKKRKKNERHRSFKWSSPDEKTDLVTEKRKPETKHEEACSSLYERLFRNCCAVKMRRNLFLDNLDKFHSNPPGSKLQKTKQLDMGELNASEQVYLLKHTNCPGFYFL